jgi:hypothetical protein
LAPLAAALAIGWVLSRRPDARAAGAVAFALAQALGIWLMTPADELWPTRNFLWMPWLAVAAAIVGPIVASTHLWRMERSLLAALCALAAAAYIVPTWEDLWPSRLTTAILFAVATTMVSRGIELTIPRAPSRLVGAALSGVSGFAALLIAALVSGRIGNPALVAASALTGACVGVSISERPRAVAGLTFPFALVFGGWCYIAAIEPAPPIPALLFIPAAPLALWLIAVGPAARWGVVKRSATATVLVAMVLGGLASWAWVSTEQASAEATAEM